MNPMSSPVPAQPPSSVTARFRAVHKRALTTPAKNLTPIYYNYGYSQGVTYGVDGRYISGDTILPNKADCYIFDPKNVVQEFTKWEA